MLDGAHPVLSAPALWVSIPPVSWHGPCGPRILQLYQGHETREWVFSPRGDWFRWDAAFLDPLRLSLAAPVPPAAPGSFEAEAVTALPGFFLRLSLAAPVPSAAPGSDEAEAVTALPGFLMA